jgi:hypothetical protein
MTIFHILTFVISFIILFLLILFVSLYLYTPPNTYPPDFTDCPDFWKVNPDGTCEIPHPNDENMGLLKDNYQEIYRYDFEDNPTEKTSYLSKYNILPEDDDDEDNILPEDGTKEGTQIYQGVKYGYYKSDIPHGYDPNNPTTNSIDFNDGGWALYGDPYCEMRRWAIRQNIQWDGIINYNKC